MSYISKRSLQNIEYIIKDIFIQSHSLLHQRILSNIFRLVFITAFIRINLDIAWTALINNDEWCRNTCPVVFSVAIHCSLTWPVTFACWPNKFLSLASPPMMHNTYCTGLYCSNRLQHVTPSQTITANCSFWPLKYLFNIYLFHFI